MRMRRRGKARATSGWAIARRLLLNPLAWSRRQSDLELASQVAALAESRDRSAVQLDEVLGQAQSDAPSLVRQPDAPLALQEEVEDLGQEVRFDADT